MNSTVYTLVIAVLAATLGAAYVYGRRTWRNTARQKMERAAGGAMSPAGQAAFERRDRRSEPWKTGGVLIGLTSLPISTALNYGGGTVFYLSTVPVFLGTAIGHVAAALTPLTGRRPQRRLASMKPRELAHYISRPELRGQHIALALPPIAIVLGILALVDPSSSPPLSLALIALGAISLGLGVAASHLRRRLLEVPNPADTVEIAYWNNTIVSRAICDLTETVTMVCLMSGYLACSTLMGSTALPMLSFAGRMIMLGLIVLIGGVTFVASFGSGYSSRIPTFIRLHQPRMGRPA